MYEITNKLNGVRIKILSGAILFLENGDYKPVYEADTDSIELTRKNDDFKEITISDVSKISVINDDVAGVSHSVPATMVEVADLIGAFFFSLNQLSGSESPDSSHIGIDPATPSAGFWYLGSEAYNIIPDGWHLTTKVELSAVVNELNFIPSGNFGDPTVYANLWANDEGVLSAFWIDTTDLQSFGYWVDVMETVKPIIIVRDEIDGRGSDTSIIPVTIAGKVYNTKLLSDGNIYLMENYQGYLLAPKKKLVLTGSKNQIWQEDNPTAHTHEITEVTDLKDVDVKRDAPNYLPAVSSVFIDALDANGDPLTRLYTHESIKNNLPTGYRLPTLAEFETMIQDAEAGYTLKQWDTSETALTQAGYDALKLGGSVGIDLEINAGFQYWHLREPNEEYRGNLDEYDVLNEAVKIDDFAVSPEVVARFWCSDESAGVGWFVHIGNIDVYDGYVTYKYRANSVEFAYLYLLKVRLIKIDGVIGGGTDTLDGDVYNLVEAGGLVWLAEDYKGSVTVEPTKTLKKVGSVLTWVND